MAFDPTPFLDILGVTVTVVVIGFAAGELANMFVTTRAINAVANTASQGINSLLAVHNVATVAQAASGSPQASASASADTKTATASS